MVAHGVLAPLVIDNGLYTVTNLQAAFQHFARVYDHPGRRFAHVFHFEFPVGRLDDTLIGYLTAGFDVEPGLFGDNFHLIAGFG
jgi:hypothetical protein